MRSIARGVAVGGTLLLLPWAEGFAQASAAGSPAPAPAWLAGCWALRSGERVVEESWMPERGGVMLGMSRTVVAGRAEEHEFVLLRTSGSSLEYRVGSGAQPEVVFVAAEPSATEVVFENPSHDFPKRIGYRSVSRDSLEAWIDGGAASKEGKIRYSYHRVDCTGRGSK
ncbi:MAG: DUF6265 family protein [Gemmatimonadales bacterium]